MSITGYTKRTLLIGVAAAGLVAGVTSASAQQKPSSPTAQGSSATQAPSSATQAPSSKSPSSTATPTPSSETGTTASANKDPANKDPANKELSGVVKKIDKDKRSLKISSPAGVEQDVRVAVSATITRDGAQAGLEQLKEGDDVRARFDPSSNQATKLDVLSKQMMEKDKGTAMKGEPKSEPKTEPKTESKGK